MRLKVGMVREPSDDDGTRSDNNAQPTRRGYLGTAGAIVGASALLSGNALAGDKKKKKKKEVEVVDPGEDNAVEDTTVFEETARVVIDEPGDYVLDEDFSIEGGEIGILIQSSLVRFNGQGNTISGDGGGRGVFIDGDIATNVVVQNLAVEDLGKGVEAFEPNNSVISEIVGENCGDGVDINNDASDNIVQDCEFDNSPIRLDSTNGNLIIGSSIVDTEDGPGISVTDSSSNDVINNDITGNDGAGISISAGINNRVIFNRITGNGGAGIELLSEDQNVFLNNDLSDNDGGPCDVEDEDNTFEGNVPECDLE